MKNTRREWLMIGIFAGYALACRVLPGFARTALGGFALPAMGALHRLTARIPFPAAEALALGLVAAAALTLPGAVLRGGAALFRWLRRALQAGLILAGALILLWAPAGALTGDVPPAPEAEPLARLCAALIDRLNASELAFPLAEEALRLAPGVAGMPERVVKAARYPEWMGAARLAGLFVPLTGEALADAAAPAPLIPFTAVHELQHLAGIADEGAANIAAWERCRDAGGPFADSARLWALRYALGRLRRLDEAAWRRVSAKMDGALKRTFQACGGEAAPAPLPGRGDYEALVGYLWGNEELGMRN